MYNEYFDFREGPFNVTPDPRFLYPTPACQEAYATLLYGIRDRKGFLVLTGEAGTGKTTLLRKVITSLEDTIQFSCFSNATLTFDELLHWICVDFGLSVPERDGRGIHIQALHTFLLEQQGKGGTAVLFLDEAQNLDDKVLEDLRLLSHLATATEKLLQVILIGQPELEQKLGQPHLRAFKRCIAVQCRLARLQECEVGPFIQHRLRVAGYKGTGIFSAEAVARIWAYSRGTPRLINVLCDNALLLAYSLSQVHVTASMVEEVAFDLQLHRGERKGCQEGIEKWAASPAVLEEWQHEDTAAPAALERQQMLAYRSKRPQSEPGGGLGWLGWVIPCAARSFSHPPLRIGAGILVAFLLLGGAGAALYPHYTTGQLSQFGSAAKEVLRDTEDYLAAVRHGLLTWFTPLPVAEMSQGEQHAAQSSRVEPPLSVQHPTTAPQHEQLTLATAPSFPALAGTINKHAPPHTPAPPIHQETSEAEESAEEQKVLVDRVAKEQSDAQAKAKGTDKAGTEKKKEAHLPQEQSFSPEDAYQRQAEARALLAQMGYAATGTVLFASAENGNTGLISLLLTAGVSPDEQDATGWTPLMYAAWHGHTTTARELVLRGAKVNTRNPVGGTALMMAAMNGHTAVAQTLQENGADINARDRKGWTPLMYAAWNGHTTTAQLLIKSGADLNAKNEDGWTALMCAAWRGHVATVQLLLERDAEPQLQSHKGETALMLATGQGNAKIMELLQSASAQE